MDKVLLSFARCRVGQDGILRAVGNRVRWGLLPASRRRVANPPQANSLPHIRSAKSSRERL
jgi:hypothetical protein